MCVCVCVCVCVYSVKYIRTHVNINLLRNRAEMYHRMYNIYICFPDGAAICILSVEELFTSAVGCVCSKKGKVWQFYLISHSLYKTFYRNELMALSSTVWCFRVSYFTFFSLCTKSRMTFYCKKCNLILSTHLKDETERKREKEKLD